MPSKGMYGGDDQFMPSWARIGADDDPIAPVGPTPQGAVTEEQVREYFRNAGVDDGTIEKIMGAANRTHGGGAAKDPGTPPGPVSPDKVEGEDEEFPQMRPETKSGPAPLFRGDRMGR